MKPFVASEYERAPSAHEKQLTFQASGRYRGLQSAGRRSATIRYLCPECGQPFRPTTMMRHRAAAHHSEGN